MRYFKGSISIYFVFSILLIISVVLSVTELARYNCQKLYLQIATDSGLDSMISLYHRKLYEYYSIYGVEYKTDELLTKEYLGYIKPYFADESSGKKIENWYNASINEQNITLSHIGLCDEKYFEKEILDYMHYAIIGKVFTFLGKEINVDEKKDVSLLLDNVKDVFDETSKSDIYSEIHEKYFDFSKDIKSLENLIKKVSTGIADANTHIQSLHNLGTSGTLSNARSVINKITSIKNDFSNLKNNLSNLKDKMNEFKNKIEEKREEYRVDKSNKTYYFDDDISSFIESEFNEFKSMVDTGSEMDIATRTAKNDIESTSNTFDGIVSGIDEYVKELERIDKEIKEAKRATGDDYDSDYISDLNEDKKNIEKDFSDYFKEIRSSIGTLVLSDIQIRVSSGNYTNEENALEKLIDFKNSTLLNLVFDQESLNQITSESTHYNNFSILSDNQTISLDKILLSEYSLDKFNYYNKAKNDETTKSGSTKLEVERLITGKTSDLENIKGTIGDIFKIRLAMNVLYIYKTQSMRSAARSFAYTVFGGFSRLLAEVMFITIIAAWGAAQSILDLKRLVANHKVNFMHNTSSWEVNIESLLTIAASGFGGYKEQDDNNFAFSYKDYLRLLLINEKQTDINERMASIMEQNVKKEQDNFDLKFMISAFDVKNNFECKHFFTNFMPIKAKDVVLKNEYKIETSGFKSFIE